MAGVTKVCTSGKAFETVAAAAEREDGTAVDGAVTGFAGSE